MYRNGRYERLEGRVSPPPQLLRRQYLPFSPSLSHHVALTCPAQDYSPPAVTPPQVAAAGATASGRSKKKEGETGRLRIGKSSDRFSRTFGPAETNRSPRFGRVESKGREAGGTGLHRRRGPLSPDSEFPEGRSWGSPPSVPEGESNPGAELSA
ncbi:hypothetical protein NL676_038302 [Syzygium grande]|nr:hypothetical protein NL676_038302 [Syzygium grande]